MTKPQRWAAIGIMLCVLIVLFVVAPKIATSFSVGVLLIALGWGFSQGRFTV